MEPQLKILDPRDIVKKYSEVNNIKNAAKRIKSFVSDTPLLENQILNEALGFRLFIKAENIQNTGSFKIRGALNQILSLDRESKGIIAASSGNHAQAVAYIGQMLGIPVTVVMPADAPTLKIENARRYKATIVTYDREKEDRDRIVSSLKDSKNLDVIHSSDHLLAIYGQGTVGLEIHKRMYEEKTSPDAIVANCCGGGLAAGIAITSDLYTNAPQIYTAEPSHFNDMQRSLELGIAQKNIKFSGSICDALMACCPAKLALPILLRYGARGLSTGDTKVMYAMSVISKYFEMMTEPSGVASVACVLENRHKFIGKNVVAIVTGGNIAPSDYIKIIDSHEYKSSYINLRKVIK